MYLALSDIGSNISYFFGNPDENPGLCDFQGMDMQFFETASILWTVVIGASLYSSVVLQQRPLENRKVLFMLTFGTSFVMMMLPVTTSSYGPSGAWCWIKGDRAGTIWRYTIFYGPLWCAFFWNSFSYFKVVKAITQFAKMSKVTEQQRRLIKLANQLRWYPIILVVSWFFLTLMRIFHSVDPDRDVYHITVVGSCFRGLYGFFNAMAYGMTPSVKEKWRELYDKVKANGLKAIFNLDPRSPSDFGLDEDSENEVQLVSDATSPMA